MRLEVCLFSTTCISLDTLLLFHLPTMALAQDCQVTLDPPTCTTPRNSHTTLTILVFGLKMHHQRSLRKYLQLWLQFSLLE
mmetsp:Transcript_24191/g.33301  ORF Transcript_24191/g.33301 Transcript_24191/m.33301 type:complete len:81 (+) Transcript_24191:667-909(+)